MLKLRIDSCPRCWIAGGLLASCLTMLAAPTAALAQTRYGSMPVYSKMDERDAVNYSSKFFNSILNDKRRILIGTMPYADPANQKKIRGWYMSYLIPSMTQLDALDKLPEKRIEVLKDLRSIRSPEVHKAVLEIIYGGVKSITEPSFKARDGSQVALHSAVRYNAMLLLGELNASEAKGTQQPFPHPYPPAFGHLVRTALVDQKQPDYLKMAAMIGILRHAKLLASPKTPQIAANTRTKLIELLVEIANQKTPPASINRSPAGHTWFRRRAIEIAGVLGGLELSQTSASAYAALEAIVADRDEAPSLRCTAAETLGLTSAKAKINSLQTTEKLGSLATQICRRELAWIDAELAKKPKAMTTGDGMGMPGMGMPGMGMPGMGMPGMGMPGMEGGGMGMPGMEGGGMGMPGMEGGGMGMPGMEGPGMGGLGMGGPGMDGEMGGYGMGGEMGGFGMPGSTQAVQDPRIDLARRRLKYQLVSVNRGLRGVSKVTVPNDQNLQRRKILDRFAAIMAATDLVNLEVDQPKSLDTLAKRVRSAMTDLEAITGGPPVEADEEADTPAISAQPELGAGPAAAGPTGAGPVPTGPGAVPAAPGPGAAGPGPATGPGVVPGAAAPGPAAGPGAIPKGPAAAGPASAPAAGPGAVPGS